MADAAHTPGCPQGWRRPDNAYRHGCRCPAVVFHVREKRRERSANLPRGRLLRAPRAGYDQIVVDHVDSGHRLTTTPAERREIITRLTRRGWSAARIADHLGCSPRTVHRARAATGKEAA